MLPNFSSQGIKAILLMGGTGERFGSALPKQFHRLAGKKVYLHTLEAFLTAQLFEEIVLVCPETWIEEVRTDLIAYPGAPLQVISGGTTRQASSRKGLLACGEQTRIVVIHDAVRPFVSQKVLEKNIAGAAQYDAVDTCIPSADTIVHAPHCEMISAIPNRAEYLRGQTPQSFSYPLILAAHAKAEKEEIFSSSDDCFLVVRLGHPVHVVQGNEENIKITSELDLFLAEQVLRLKNVALSESDLLSSLQGKKIAVTGGTGGIGQALCQLLQAEGAIPIPISRSSVKYQADLTAFTEVERVFAQIESDYGQLDALINSVGHLKTGGVKDLSPEEIEAQIAINLFSVLYSCKCARMKPGGHILNIASSSYGRGRKNYAIYSSAKAAVVNFTQALAEERSDLCVNALIPQRTCTPMRHSNFPGEDPETLLSPDEVAREILFVLRRQSVTGSLIAVRKK
jgi:2-C-methyl-D-erythritol 4-phosphate cytidylyltransferase